MKQLLILFTFSFIVFSTTACEDKKEFVLNGKYIDHEDFIDFSEHHHIYLYKLLTPNPTYQDIIQGKASIIADSTEISETREFTFKGKIAQGEPGIYFVGIYPPEGLFLEGDRSYRGYCELVIIEPGTITMTLHNDKTEIKGTPVNEKLTEIFLNLYESEKEIEDSIRQENPERNYHPDDIKNHPLMQNFKEKMAPEYYAFMKENAKNDVGKFLFNVAASFCSKEQMQEIRSMMKADKQQE